MDDPLYKINEVADILRLSNSKIRALIKTGVLEYFNVSQGNERKIYRISKSQIEKFKTRNG